MTSEEISLLKEGDRVYWATGTTVKQHYSGVFVKFTGNVLDYKVMLVRSDDGFEDEILDPFLISEEAFIQYTAPKTFKPQRVKSLISKKEEISDDSSEEEILNEVLTEEIDRKIEEHVNKISVVKSLPSLPISKDNLAKVTGHRTGGVGPAPNLKTLQMLLISDGISIERDKAKWVRYHLTFSDGRTESFDFSGKVFELYNIYLDEGIDGILKLKK